MTQRDQLRALIIAFCNARESRTFSLQELHAAHGNYEQIGIGGNTPRNTVRRLLQQLRDDGILSFENNRGNYTLRAIDLLDSERRTLEERGIDLIAPDMTERREHLVETYTRDTRLVREARELLGTQCLVPRCGNTFTKADGAPYIEVHHIVPLCLGGEDGLWNLSVVCAHHHRMAHFAGADTKARLQDELLEITQRRL